MALQLGAEPGQVTLREFTLSDEEAFMSWASDPRVARFQLRDAFTSLGRARRYIADHVLQHPWAWLRRLEAVADVENPASQRVLEKAGFVREGVLRRYLLLKGRPRDMVMFSIVDTDRHRQQQQKQPVESDRP